MTLLRGVDAFVTVLLTVMAGLTAFGCFAVANEKLDEGGWASFPLALIAIAFAAIAAYLVTLTFTA